MFVTSYSVTYCIYVQEKPGICFHHSCAVYDECQWSDTFWLADCIRLIVQYTISLSSFCKLIWRHWTYKMPVRYIFFECVNKIKHIFSVIHYTICGAVCFQFAHFPCNDWENIYIYIYTLSYNYHQIGSMYYYPLFRVRSCEMILWILYHVSIKWSEMSSQIGLHRRVVMFCLALFDDIAPITDNTG